MSLMIAFFICLILKELWKKFTEETYLKYGFNAKLLNSELRSGKGLNPQLSPTLGYDPITRIVTPLLLLFIYYILLSLDRLLVNLRITISAKISDLK